VINTAKKKKRKVLTDGTVNTNQGKKAANSNKKHDHRVGLTTLIL
jgi:hypothetical protein